MKTRAGKESKETAIAVVGAAGRMGQRVIACATEQRGIRVAAAIEAASCPAIGRDAGLVAGIAELGIPIAADLAAARGQAQVVLDFALAEGAAARIGQYAAMGLPFVIGTTGMDGKARTALERAADKVAFVHAPNFSVGVNVLFQLCARAAAVLRDGYDVEILEIHHKWKNDAPSGTAIRLAEMIEKMRGLDPDTQRVYGRKGMVGARPAAQIGIHALRGGDVVGDHTVIFAAEGERIELVHKAGNRDTFVRGALLAALFLVGKSPGAYTMNDVLDL